MPLSHITNLSFLMPGNYDDEDPARGLEETLELIERGEQLGYSMALVRQLHLERGISSGATFLAAASHRTKTIGLGTAVIQLGYENPFRLAEDLATVEILSGGRLNVGVSVGQPPFAHLLGEYIDTAPEADYSHRRAGRLASALQSRRLSDNLESGNAAGAQVPRLRPIARGLTDRLWYGGGSQRSARWAGWAGFNLLSGNIVSGEGTDDFLTAQVTLISRFRQEWLPEREPRVALGRVILPAERQRGHPPAVCGLRRLPNGTDKIRPWGAPYTFPARYHRDRRRDPREQLSRNPVLQLVSELRLELPYEFQAEDYGQMIEDFTRLFRTVRNAEPPLRNAG